MLSRDVIRERFRQILTSSRELVNVTEVQELFLEMERRNYNVRQIKWLMGISCVVFFYLSGKQIKKWLSSQTTEVAHQSMDDPEFKKRVSYLSTEIAQEVLENLLINQQLKKQIENYATDILEQSVKELYQREDFKHETKKSISRLIESEMVETRVNTLCKNLAEELLSDVRLQKKIGDTIRNSIYYGFMPSYFTETIEKRDRQIYQNTDSTDDS